MKKTAKAFHRAINVYSSVFKLTLGFSIFVLCSLALLPLVSSYLNVGSAFLRFSSILYDMNLAQAVIFTLVGLISIAFMSLFLSSIITTIKLKETLDHFRFKKVWNAFPDYVTRMFFLLLFLSVISVATGTFLEASSVPRFVIQIVVAAIWIPFIFSPQILILEDLGVAEALDDSLNFVKKSSKELAVYLLFGILLLLIVALIEFLLSFVFVWEHKLISVILVSVFVLPFLQVFGTELYLMRYPLHHN